MQQTVSKADKFTIAGEENEQKGDLAAAAVNYNKSFQLRYRVLGDQDPVVLSTAHKLAELMIQQKKFAAAEKYLNWCLKAKARKYGSGSYEFAETHAALGNLYLAQNQYDKAISKLKHVVSLNERYQGANAKSTYDARKNLAEAYLKSGDEVKYEKLVTAAVLAHAQVSEEGNSTKQELGRGAQTGTAE